MRLTDEMVELDDRKYRDRNVLVELKYMGREIKHRKTVTNDDLRFMAWLYRSALNLQKDQEAVEPTVSSLETHDGLCSWWYQCGKCKMPIDHGDRFCRHCGKKVKWE